MAEKAKVLLRRTETYDPAAVAAIIRTARHRRRIRGCPPKRKTLVLLFFLKAGIINPLFRLDLIIDAYPFLYLTWLKRFFSGRF